MKTVAVISDLHCGHRAGLTSPEYWYQENDISATRNNFARIQRAMWQWYEKTVLAIGPVDVLICNGDALDGKGEKSGGNELITTDRDEQISIAKQAIELWQAKKIFIIEGTPYHTGKEESWESVLADLVGARFAAHEWIDVDGVIFDCRHKIGSSVIPHGRHTAPARDMLWNRLWAERGTHPNADVLIRSHVHYHTVTGDAYKTAITTPCLQSHSKFGSRECSGTNDLGLITFAVDKGSYSMRYYNCDIDLTVKTVKA